MKKLITYSLLLSLSLSLIGCGNATNQPSERAVEKREKHEENKNLTIQYEDSGYQNMPIKASVDVFAMDTVMLLTVYSDAKEKAQKALNEAAQELFRLDNYLSTNITTSELYEINTKGQGTFSEEGKALLKKSKVFYEKTQGIFNIAIYPLVKAWGFTTDSYQVPEKSEIEALLKTSNFNEVSFDEASGKVVLEKEGMGIDFGGIAKGYASDRVMAIFKANGITSGLVSLGGNVALLGTKPDGKDFVVGVQNPNNPEAYFGALKAHDCSVITSGAYQRFFEEKGKTYHHIIDPRSGYPADSGLTSVTIITKDGTLGDSYATTLFILGKEKAIAFWQNNHTDFDMILVDKENKVTITENLAPFYQDNDFAAPEIVRVNG